VAVLVLFGVILLACAAEVVRLARDARADADSEQDVFDRRRESRLAAWRRLRTLAQEFRRGRAAAKATAPQSAASATPVAVEPVAPVSPVVARTVVPAPAQPHGEVTVRLAPAPRPRTERDYPTIPAMSGR
jgi:hypothetical protein